VPAVGAEGDTEDLVQRRGRQGNEVGPVDAAQVVPFPAAQPRVALLEQLLGPGEVVEPPLQPGLGDLAEIEVAPGLGAGVLGVAAGGGLVVGLAFGPPPLGGHPGDPGEADQQQRGQQAGPHRVAPPGPPQAFHHRDAAGADRPILHEPFQVVRQLGSALVAVGRVAGDGLEHDRLQVGWHSGLELARPGWLRVHYQVQEFAAVRLAERGAEGEQFVERQPQPVHVPAGVGATLEALRGHVAKGADEEAAAR
jgi:hypothetical protein